MLMCQPSIYLKYPWFWKQRLIRLHSALFLKIFLKEICHHCDFYSNEWILALLEAGIKISLYRSVHHFGTNWNIWTVIGRIAMKFCTDIHGPQRINPSDFGDLLAFSFVPPWVDIGGVEWNVLTIVRWIAMTFCTGIDGPLRMNCNDWWFFFIYHHHQVKILWPALTCKTNDIPINPQLYFVLVISKCWQANMLYWVRVNMVNIKPAKR